MKRHQAGNNGIVVVIIVALALVFGTVGRLVARNMHRPPNPPTFATNSTTLADDTDSPYENQHFGFQLRLPTAWKVYSVQEAIACTTILQQYADDYFLIKSPTANVHETLFVVNKAEMKVDYFTSSPLDQVYEQVKDKGEEFYKMVLEQNPGVFDVEKQYRAEIAKYEQIDIGGFHVYRRADELAEVYREDNYFVANGTMMNIYYYARKDGAEPNILMNRMRAIVDRTLSKS
jgi:hypothetical protein